MRVVHLVSTLGPTSAARHLAHVAPRLAGERLVINLGIALPFEPTLRDAGVPVRPVRFRSPIDVAAARDLTRLVREFAPDVVHVWGNLAAAIAIILAPNPFRKPPFAIVIGDTRPDSRSPFVGRIRRLARATRDPFPIVEPEPIVPADLGLPAGTRTILNVGGFDEQSDQRAAVWSYDMLRYVDSTAHLVAVGDGPRRAKVEAFARSVARGDPRIHFVGPRADVPALLRSAAIAFVSHRAGGRTFLAEALAAGTPVVAVASPDSNAIVRDGENGLLVQRGDYPAQAGAMLRILTEPDLATRLRNAGRQRRFPSPAEAAADLDGFYRTIAG